MEMDVPLIALHLPYRGCLGTRFVLYYFQIFEQVDEPGNVPAVGRQSVSCAEVEFVTLQPPSGQTCDNYMAKYISAAGGYLRNPNDTSNCQFCSVATTDQFLEANFNIYYSHHWRDFGFMMAFILFNVSFLTHMPVGKI